MAIPNPNLYKDIAVTGFLPVGVSGRSGILSTFGYHTWDVPVPNIIPDHREKGLNLLITQFRSKRAANSSPNPNNMYKILTPFLDQIQDIEYAISDIGTLRWLDVAQGQQLDELGAIYNLTRDGRDDEEYRLAIKFQIYIARSSGEPESIIAFVKDITNATRVRLIEAYPAGLYIFTNGDNVLTTRNIIPLIERVMASGVKLRGLFYLDPDAVYFSFEWDGDTPTDGSKGLSELNYTEGGQDVGGQLFELII